MGRHFSLGEPAQWVSPVAEWVDALMVAFRHTYLLPCWQTL